MGMIFTMTPKKPIPPSLAIKTTASRVAGGLPVTMHTILHTQSSNCSSCGH